MTETEAEKTDQSIPFYPNHILTEAKVALGLLVIVIFIGALATIWPIGLEAPADPMDTPAHAQPEWYFLFLYEMLKYVPKSLGAGIPIVGLIVLTLWPFFDRKSDTPRAKRVRWGLAIVACLMVTALTVMAAIG